MITRRDELKIELEKIENLEERIPETKATDFLGYLRGLLAKNLNADLPKEYKVLIEIIINDIIEKYKTGHSTILKVPFMSWKGKSGLFIKRYPKFFQCIEFRKEDENSKPKEVKTEIPIEDVNMCLKALEKHQYNELITIREITEQICVLQDIEFESYEKMFGTRKVYLKKVYYPLKICENLGFITYSKRGDITLLKAIVYQTQF